MAGSAHFTIEDAEGGFQAKFYGANGELVFITEIYERRAGAENAIDLLKTSASEAPVKDES